LHFKNHQTSRNLKFNNLGIPQSLKLRISMEKILPISLKLNFTPNTLGVKSSSLRNTAESHRTKSQNGTMPWKKFFSMDLRHALSGSLSTQDFNQGHYFIFSVRERIRSGPRKLARPNDSLTSPLPTFPPHKVTAVPT